MNTVPEFFISICLTQETTVPDELLAIANLSIYCSKSMKYWEILYILDEKLIPEMKSNAARIAPIRNLRILPVRGSVGYYRRRMIAASEAIGDIVVLTSFGELPRADLVLFAQRAMHESRVILGRRPGLPGLQSLGRELIGLLSSYKVDDRTLKTIALPRNQLISILERPTAALDLRFEPKTGLMPYEYVAISPPAHSSGVSFSERTDFLIEIVKSSAPRFLAWFASLAMIGTATAILYGFYALGVIFFKENVQPGWFTSAIVQSASIAFLLTGLAIISLGIASICDRLYGEKHCEVTDEIGNITFYDSHVELNVEVQKGRGKEFGQ